MQRYKIYNQSIEQFLEEYEGDLFMGCFCDPPYALTGKSGSGGFMGKKWDSVVPGIEVWSKVIDLLFPGSSLLAFGGTRTFHRLMVAIEDSGFDIRDTIMYLYGSGFPKSHNVSKAIDNFFGEEREVIKKGTSGKTAILPDRGGMSDFDITIPSTDLAKTFDGYGSAIKPSYEPIVWAMKPMPSTYANNAIEYGVAGINVDGTRVGEEERYNAAASAALGTFNCSPGSGTEYQGKEVIGRFPANTIVDGSDEVLELFPDTKTGGPNYSMSPTTDVVYNTDGYKSRSRIGYSHDGSAARFFYTAKSSKRERNLGLENHDPQKRDKSRNNDQPSMNGGEGSPYNRGAKPTKNFHPTVKPLSLCYYLAKLLLPPDTGRTRRILVPFSGSGSEMIGCLLAGWDEVIAVELESGYCEIAELRIQWWLAESKRLGLSDPQDILKLSKNTKPKKKKESKIIQRSLL